MLSARREPSFEAFVALHPFVQDDRVPDSVPADIMDLPYKTLGGQS